MNLSNLVIKVGVAPSSTFGSGNPIFYRLTYDDIKEKPFQVLNKTAIMLAKQSQPDSCVNNDEEDIEKYSVTYVYKDSDGDDILIDTEAGLKIAMKEAIDDNKLKLIATIKKIGSIHEKQVVEKVTDMKEGNKQDNKEQNKLQPFIHGKHECKNCGDNPIIGKRFHGIVDGKPIDLCEKCNDKTTTTENLEEVEDEADKDRQIQWRRKHRAKFLEVMNTIKAQRQALRRMKQLVRTSLTANKIGEYNAVEKLKLALQEAMDLEIDPPVVVQKDQVGKEVMDEEKNKNEWQDVEEEFYVEGKDSSTIMAA